MDRNIIAKMINATQKLSLSARRAWIEIKFNIGGEDIEVVALRKESVDRNMIVTPLFVFVF